MRFSCIGYDIRVWPAVSSISADATAWPQNEFVYNDVIKKLDLRENFFQLIQINSKKELTELVKFTNQCNGVKLVAFEIPSEILSAIQKSKNLKIDTCSGNIDKWDFLGIDVCDLNGFFSIFHMDILNEKFSTIFLSSEIEKALELVQSANVLVPSHSPFILVKIWGMRRIGIE